MPISSYLITPVANYSMLIRIFLLALTILYVKADNAGSDGITCAFCKAGLASMTQQIQSNNDVMAQMGESISQGCDQVPNELQRRACRLTLDDNFPLFLQVCCDMPK
ncbi:unnamed protein product [Cylicostephanus goldi]|uniref:Saposin B-type domain-containing protein n=1 Tax=Cylicostephanus goldi TaxID=71465 RepID=A0A3P7RBL5_CYLGO|nr:unnamed protein product [Cylicostephanus goldi]